MSWVSTSLVATSPEPEDRPVITNKLRGGRREDNIMTSPEATQASQPQIAVKSSTALLMQSLGALIFGMVILFAVGFAPMEVAHNAAHDVRHSLAFPCH